MASRRTRRNDSSIAVVVAAWVIVTVTGLTGCRTIQRFGENRQVLDARKKSRLGMQAMHQGQWDAAESLFSEALQHSEADERAHRGLAEAYWNRGQTDLAIAHMEQAVRRSASDPKLVVRLGEMYLHAGRLESAEQQSEIALQGDRNSAEIWALRGDCLKARNQNEDALAAYHRALALQPDFANAKLRVAELYLQNDQYDRLLATLDQIGPVGDDSLAPTRVHMLRGIAMRNLGRPELASKHFAKASESDPTRAEPHLQIAAIELERGSEELASRSIARALELDRNLVESSGWVAYLLPSDRMIAAEDDAERR